MRERQRYSKTRLYHVWQSMKSRCNNPNDPEYKNYGGRGITVCDKWENSFLEFREWAMQAGYDEEAPRGACTIDRIDNDGPYSPENCRWVDMKEQSKNKRPYPKNRKPSQPIGQIEINGEKKSARQWREEAELSQSTFYARWHRGERGEELFRPPRKSEPLPVRYDGKGERKKCPPGSLSMPVKRTITPEEQTAK